MPEGNARTALKRWRGRASNKDGAGWQPSDAGKFYASVERVRDWRSMPIKSPRQIITVITADPP